MAHVGIDRRRHNAAPLLPPPADMARCAYDCGRLVWNFDKGTCALCGPGERQSGHPERVPCTIRPEVSSAALEGDPVYEAWRATEAERAGA